MGLGFQCLGYLSFGFGFGSGNFANFEYDNLKWKKKILVFGYGFEYRNFFNF